MEGEETAGRSWLGFRKSFPGGALGDFINAPFGAFHKCRFEMPCCHLEQGQDVPPWAVSWAQRLTPPLFPALYRKNNLRFEGIAHTLSSLHVLSHSDYCKKNRKVLSLARAGPGSARLARPLYFLLVVPSCCSSRGKEGCVDFRLPV